jgi:hypothetical protein
LARADGILQRDDRPVEERVAKFYRERQDAWIEYRRFRTLDLCSPSQRQGFLRGGEAGVFLTVIP